jgi:hypothetical protein
VRPDEEETVLGLTGETPAEAIGLALGAASACWENLEAAGVFQSTRAGQIAEELITYLGVTGGTDGEEEVTVVEEGDHVEILLSTGDEIRGLLVAVFSGEGETDGLIHVQVDGEPRPTNVYERHIVLLKRFPAVGE